MFYLPLTVAILCALFLIFKLWPVFIKSAPWDPTPTRAVRRMLEMADLKKGEKLYDLGCGDGRIIIIAAKYYRANAVGIELDPLRYFITKIRIKRNGLKNARAVRENLFNTDLTDADVVTMFLHQSVNNRMKNKLIKELKDGARVVSHIWTFDGWKPDEIDKKNRVYLYRIKKD